MKVSDLGNSKSDINARLDVLRHMKGHDLEERTVIREEIQYWQQKLLEASRKDVIARFLDTEVHDES